MKFKDFLLEKFAASFKSGGEYVEVFENPTKKEIKDANKDSYGDGVRFGIQDKPNGKLWAWKGNILHSDVVNRVPASSKIKFDFGFYWEPRNADMSTWLRNDWPPYPLKRWSELKNKKSIIKKMRKIIPQATKLFSWDHESNDIGIVVDLKTGKEQRGGNLEPF